MNPQEIIVPIDDRKEVPLFVPPTLQWKIVGDDVCSHINIPYG
jgi:hypothetical protein